MRIVEDICEVKAGNILESCVMATLKKFVLSWRNRGKIIGFDKTGI